jgi:hypothetical protein
MSMKIETILPEGFWDAFSHLSDPSDIWRQSDATLWVTMVEELVIQDIISEPETYRNFSEHEYTLLRNPCSVHVPSALARFTKDNARRIAWFDAHPDSPDPYPYDLDDDYAEEPIYSVGMYAEMAGDNEWFTVVGVWSTFEVGGYFGYASADGDDNRRLVVLFG